jgi:hypothetical protein
MSRLIADVLAYLRAVFVETWQKVFTLFDILGVVLFFYPKLAGTLVSDESLARTIGGLVFFISFLLANFALYRKLAEANAYKADIRLEIVERSFSHSHGSGRSPFREVASNPYGFNKQGIPDWCTLWAKIRVANIGYEKGSLDCEIDEAKTKLPPLFACDPDSSKVSFDSPIRGIEARSASSMDFFFDVLLAEREPRAFARPLKALIKSKQGYQVVLQYKTKRVDGESEARQLSIKGDFHNFYQETQKYWDENGFKELLDLARIT